MHVGKSHTWRQHAGLRTDRGERGKGERCREGERKGRDAGSER